MSKFCSPGRFLPLPISLLFSASLSGCGSGEIFSPASDSGESIASHTPERVFRTEILGRQGERLLATAECAPDSNGVFPEGSSVPDHGSRSIQVRNKNGKVETLSVYFASGGGCIQRPLRDLWAASLNWRAMQWKGTGELSVHKIPPPNSGAMQSFRANYHTVQMGLISIDWALDWTYYLNVGNFQDPENIIIHFIKSWGTSHISWWRGKVELQQLTPQVTSFKLDAELSATSRGESDVMAEVGEYYDKLKAAQPNWGALPTR